MINRKHKIYNLAIFSCVVLVFELFAITSIRWAEGGPLGDFEIPVGVVAVLLSLACIYYGRVGHRLTSRGMRSILDDSVHFRRLAPGKQVLWAALGSVGGLFLAVGTAWLWHGIHFEAESSVEIVLVCFVAMAGLFLLKFRSAGTRMEVEEEGSPGGSESLILFLSLNNGRDDDPKRPSLPSLLARTASTFPDEQDLKEAFGLNNWLMPLLSIRYQILKGQESGEPHLQHVLLIASPESSRQVADFRAVVDHWLPGHGLNIDEITKEKGGIDFVAPRSLWEMIGCAYARAEELRAGSVILDLTGGKSQCSAAGAVASLSGNRYFKYVDTEGNHSQHAYSISVEEERAELG